MQKAMSNVNLWLTTFWGNKKQCTIKHWALALTRTIPWYHHTQSGMHYIWPLAVELTCSEYTLLVCPCSVCRHTPSRGSHTFTR